MTCTVSTCLKMRLKMYEIIQQPQGLTFVLYPPRVQVWTKDAINRSSWALQDVNLRDSDGLCIQGFEEQLLYSAYYTYQCIYVENNTVSSSTHSECLCCIYDKLNYNLLCHMTSILLFKIVRTTGALSASFLQGWKADERSHCHSPLPGARQSNGWASSSHHCW